MLVKHLLLRRGGAQKMVCFYSCGCAVQALHAISVGRRSCAEKRNASAALSVM